MFAHKLAIRLGRTVAEIERDVSAKEFASWIAFDRISPIGDERIDINFALNTLHTLAPHTKKNSKLKLGDFLPNWGGKIRQSADALRAKILGTFKGANMLRDKRNG